jgi:hypothetical protein
MPFITAPSDTARAVASLVHDALALTLLLHVALTAATRSGLRLRGRGDRGQATTEYALVLLAAALVGLMVVAWATAGGGTERIGRLFDNVIDAVTDRL